MTLDELIEDLVDLRQRIPSAGSAQVVGVGDTPPEYQQGEVLLDIDPESDWDPGFDGEPDDPKNDPA